MVLVEIPDPKRLPARKPMPDVEARDQPAPGIVLNNPAGRNRPPLSVFLGNRPYRRYVAAGNRGNNLRPLIAPPGDIPMPRRRGDGVRRASITAPP